MITVETLEKLALRRHTAVYPNILREYFQHVFLAELYKLPGSEKLLFKGDTALRIIYGSPRFSEDMDFSLYGIGRNRIKIFVENLFLEVLTAVERIGITVEIGTKLGLTHGGYFAVATFTYLNYKPVRVEINISARLAGIRRGLRGEVDSVVGDFVPAYTVIHLPQSEMVNEKIFGALLERRKPRDFYDLYFIMRKGMLLPSQKRRLAALKDTILRYAGDIDFRRELAAFLPSDQQPIIRDFAKVLTLEISRQTGG